MFPVIPTICLGWVLYIRKEFPVLPLPSKCHKHN